MFLRLKLLNTQIFYLFCPPLYGVYMSCRDLGCLIKRDMVMILAVPLSLAVFFLGLSGMYFTIDSMVKTFLGFLLLIPIHELAHYLVIKLLKKRARIKFLVRYIALVIDYIDELMWNELLYTALSPQIFITLPLLLLYIATGDTVIYTLLVFHVATSVVDLINALRLTMFFKGYRFRLCRENGKIVGYITIKPDGRCIMYML